VTRNFAALADFAKMVCFLCVLKFTLELTANAQFSIVDQELNIISFIRGFGGIHSQRGA
jgi:hypothetical protein